LDSNGVFSCLSLILLRFSTPELIFQIGHPNLKDIKTSLVKNFNIWTIVSNFIVSIKWFVKYNNLLYFQEFESFLGRDLSCFLFSLMLLSKRKSCCEGAGRINYCAYWITICK